MATPTRVNVKKRVQDGAQQRPVPTMIETYSWLDVTPPNRVALRAERRRQRVDLRAPGDRREAPEDRAEADGEHDHGELRLADDPPEHCPRPALRRRPPPVADGEDEGGPVPEAVPDHEHVAGERAEHQQVALGEIHQLGGLVDEDEAEGDQPVDAAHGQAIQYELQDSVQDCPPRAALLWRWRIAALRHRLYRGLGRRSMPRAIDPGRTYARSEARFTVQRSSRSGSGSWAMPGTREVAISPGPLRTSSGLPRSFR